jgi:pyruvate,water dikinase
MTYRERMGETSTPRMGVIVQHLISADTAGVLFTHDPITGAEQLVVEAAWGLGEAVVAGGVIPDRFRIGAAGEVLERTPGAKELMVVCDPDGGTRRQHVAADRARQLCLDDDQLTQLHLLAGRCVDLYGNARDIEWAFAGDTLYLLQSRPITQPLGRRFGALPGASVPIEQ